MAEHAETFLALYRADMDAALHVQPVDSWNSFPLFQLHNNFLCTDGEPHFHLEIIKLSQLLFEWPAEMC